MQNDRLVKFAVFAGLDAVQRARCDELTHELFIAEGHVLMHEGDPAWELLAIEEGCAEVRREGMQVAVVGPGDVVGEVGVVGRRPRSATVVARTPLRALALDGWDLARLAQVAPQVVDRLRVLAAERAL